MRVYSTSAGLHAEGLEPGQDVVLRLSGRDAGRVPAGVAADDHLIPSRRAEIDREALEVLARWRATCDAPLTVDDLCLPFVLEWPLMSIVVAAHRAGAGLAAAIERFGPETIELVDARPSDRALVKAVAAAAGVPIRDTDGARGSADVPAPERAPLPPLRRVRRLATDVALGAGSPTVLRRGAVVAMSYWSMVPLLDRMLDEPSMRVAIPLSTRPASPRRALRAALDGGWIGTASPLARARGRRAAERGLRRARALPAPTLGVGSYDIGAAIHAELIEEVLRSAAEQLANAAILRRAYRRGRPRLVVLSYDTLPWPRLVASLAREAGIPTFLVSHSAYLMPQTLKDAEIADEVAVYSEAVAFEGMRRDRPVHTVGYPVPVDVAPERAAPQNPRRVVVLGVNGHPYTARFDERVTLRHFHVALEALAEAVPEVEVVLRPHPSQDLAPIRAVADDFPGLAVGVDAATDIMELLESADLCIGGLTAATLQAAVAGTPVIVLNVTGFAWRWPLGGDTPVPVTADAGALRDAISRWLRDGRIPGRETLLGALGADRSDAVDQLAELVLRAADRPRVRADEPRAPVLHGG